MWWRSPNHVTAYDDHFEDQPAQGALYQWGIGIGVAASFLIYGLIVLRDQTATWGDHVTLELNGANAIAYGISVISIALFVHFHYFWGNIYEQIWFAVLGKILSASGFIVSTAYLCYRVGVLGRI